MAEHGIDGSGDRHRVRRHRLRHRRHDLGRRGAGRDGCARSSAWRRSGRCRSSAATAPSASRGGWRWRCVLDAFGGEVPLDAPAALRATCPIAELVGASRRCCARGLAPLARGVGRYFDAFGALFLGRHAASFEGQIALEWNQAADPACHPRRTRFDIAPVRSSAARSTCGRRVRDAVDRRRHGEPVAAIAAAFHNTMAEATAAVVRARRHGGTARCRSWRRAGVSRTRGWRRASARRSRPSIDGAAAARGAAGRRRHRARPGGRRDALVRAGLRLRYERPCGRRSAALQGCRET